MKILSDEELIQAYIEAKKLGLDTKFIQQLATEIKKRQIYIDKGRQQK